MTDKEIIKLLEWTGHLAYPFGRAQTLKSDPHELPLSDSCVQNAIASYQEFMIENLESLALKHHARVAHCDGEVGPATEELFAQPRCGCCDYGPDVQPALGNGSWASCHGIGEFHAATVHVNEGGMPSFLRPVFDEVWRGNVAAYEDIGLRWIRKDDEQANIEVSFVGRSNGWIGLAVVGQGESCNSQIWAKFLATYRPSNIVDAWTELVMHELGHNAGLQHSRGGIMNPSIIVGLPPTWKGDPSESILKRYYGGEPIEPPPPVPPVPPEVGEYGILEWFREGVSVGQFDVLRRAGVPK